MDDGEDDEAEPAPPVEAPPPKRRTKHTSSLKSKLRQQGRVTPQQQVSTWLLGVTLNPQQAQPLTEISPAVR